jgi:hypothetical protein
LIDSSESEEEEQREKSKKNIPRWATSPFLSSALKQQALKQPEEIFGNVKPLVLEGSGI